ncbi:MAG: 4-alpha-glucanotransferase [Myxococcota bacterium]
MRRSGVLLHPTSLPGFGPCGDLGDAAIRFLDWLVEAGCDLWQTLPLNPTGGSFSPYDSPSSFAGASHLISIDRLMLEGLLTASEIVGRPPNTDQVNVDALQSWHTPLVSRAAWRLAEEDPDAVDAFSAQHPWLDDWALFEALRTDLSVQGWWDFPEPLQERDADAMASARERLANPIRVQQAIQLLFDRQWSAIRAAAHERGIQIIGDLPIFVHRAGCDTWSHRALFRWQRDVWRPDPIAGAPPDTFTELGQTWGNPHYNWPAHRAEDFAWWIRRFQSSIRRTDILRVDHFRGFAAAWEIPADAADARAGAWGPTPGNALFAAVAGALDGLPIIAEDLGVITPDVDALRRSLGVPGMKVLQFAFGSGPEHDFLPYNFDGDLWVAYSGTHDTDTAVGWYATASEEARHQYRVYAGSDGSEPGWDLIRLAWSSTAKWAIAPMQDVLNLDGRARMNTPGTIEGNWRWRTTTLPILAARRLAQEGWVYGREAKRVKAEL